MRVLVCGGRDYQDYDKIWKELDILNQKRCYTLHDTIIVIQGGASGADQGARFWCTERKVPCENYPADWSAHGKAAGPIRNQRMIDEGRPDLVLAFPGGAGTADMTRRAKKAGVRVIAIQ